MKILKIQIRSAPNVGKVWISRKKSSWPYLGPSQSIFSMERKNKNNKVLSIFLGGPMGTIHPVWALAAIHPRWGNRYFCGSQISGFPKFCSLSARFFRGGTWISGNLEIWEPARTANFWEPSFQKSDDTST